MREITHTLPIMPTLVGQSWVVTMLQAQLKRLLLLIERFNTLQNSLVCIWPSISIPACALVTWSAFIAEAVIRRNYHFLQINWNRITFKNAYSFVIPFDIYLPTYQPGPQAPVNTFWRDQTRLSIEIKAPLDACRNPRRVACVRKYRAISTLKITEQLQELQSSPHCCREWPARQVKFPLIRLWRWKKRVMILSSCLKKDKLMFQSTNSMHEK
jgi:hypothetical protein